jgi:hypothetical protein
MKKQQYEPDIIGGQGALTKAESSLNYAACAKPITVCIKIKFSMALALSNMVDIIEIMENYVERIRPPEHIRPKLDITYAIENQSVILLELRPSFKNPAMIMKSDYAKATFVKSLNKWKVYWMRGNLKWSLYDPKPTVRNLEAFTRLVEEDKYHCFKG